MSHEAWLARITVDPKVMVGKPVIRGARLTYLPLADASQQRSKNVVPPQHKRY
jgi:uncharacterized protein (DUF433 family)